MFYEKKTTSVLAKLSSLDNEGSCSYVPFTFVGCDWRVWFYLAGDRNDPYLGVCVELMDFPPGWRRNVILSFTLVNHGGKSNILQEGHSCFDAKSKCWGFNDFVSCTKLHEKGEGFVMNDTLNIIATLQVCGADIAEISESSSNKEGNQASVGKSQGSSSCQVKQETENTSKENLDGDDDTSEEGSDDDITSDEGSDDDDDDDDTCEESKEDVGNDDASSPVSDGEVRVSRLSQLSELSRLSRILEAMTVVSNGNNDDATEESSDEDDDDSSLVSNDGGRDVSSVNQVKSLEDTSHTVETANNLLDVNGFKVSSSQVESVCHIFKKHPDIASGFRPKNQKIRTAYMNELLTLIETLCQSPEKLSEDDLSNADDTLDDLTDVGFKLNWLKKKLSEVSEKKKKEQGSVAKIQTMEEELQKLKKMFLDLETQLQKEKAESLAAKTPLSFNDVV